jgi:chromosome segregation ATPase
MPAPPVPEGSLQTDLQKTKNDASVWPNGLRAEVISTMQQLVAFAGSFQQQVQAIVSLDGPELAKLPAVMAALQGQVATLAAQVKKAAADVGAFRATLDADTSTLGADLNGVNQQIAALQQQMQQLQQQVQAQQAKIQYYQDHPWLLVLEGLTIVGLFETLHDMMSAEQAAAQGMAQIQQIQNTLGPLMQGVGPLRALITSVTGLSGGLINLDTAIDEAGNAIGQLPTGQGPDAVFVAELQTLSENFAQAQQIAEEILQS